MPTISGEITAGVVLDSPVGAAGLRSTEGIHVVDAIAEGRLIANPFECSNTRGWDGWVGERPCSRTSIL